MSLLTLNTWMSWVRDTSLLDLAMHVAVSSLSPVSIHTWMPVKRRHCTKNTTVFLSPAFLSISRPCLTPSCSLSSTPVATCIHKWGYKEAVYLRHRAASCPSVGSPPLPPPAPPCSSPRSAWRHCTCIIALSNHYLVLRHGAEKTNLCSKSWYRVLFLGECLAGHHACPQ